MTEAKDEHESAKDRKETLPETADKELLARRDFLQKAGKSGITAGLASFLLVGGVSKNSFAAQDCISPWGSGARDSQGHDACLSAANPDECEKSASGVSGDDCSYPSPPNSGVFDQDICADNGVADDSCTVTPLWDDDVCVIAGQQGDV